MNALDVHAIPAWATLQGIWRDIAHRIRHALRKRRLQHELAQLDGEALRDLGLHCSELSSFCAEYHGLADATRRRLALSR